MEQKINLDNGYYFEKINDKNCLFKNQNIIDVKDLSFNKIKNDTLLEIDFCNIEPSNYKHILKKMITLRKFKPKCFGVKFKNNGILLGYLINYNEYNAQHNDLLIAINAMLYPSTYEKYNYIYDTACKFLDKQFSENNLCDFQCNKCIEKRETNSNSNVGCCRHFKYKFLAPFIPNNSLIICEYLKEKQCTVQCLSCKLFTCRSLRKKGIKFKIKDIIYLDIFFNLIQKYILKTSTFTSKKEILDKLILYK